MKKLYFLSILSILAHILPAQRAKITFRVSMKNQTIDPTGVFVMGKIGDDVTKHWSPTAFKMDMINGQMSVYAITITQSVPSQTRLDYKFSNGNTGTKVESSGLFAGGCGVSNGLGGYNRQLTIPAGTLSMTLPAFNYNKCDSVTNITGVRELKTAENAYLAPNPSYGKTHIFFENPSQALHSIDIVNMTGQVVKSLPASRQEQFDVDTAGLSKGVYIARIRNQEGDSKTLTFVIE